MKRTAALLPLLFFSFISYAQSETGLWTWEDGVIFTDQPVYGTKGVAAAANNPGSQAGAVTWRDSNGNGWLLSIRKKVLWKFETASRQWTWVAGDTSGVLAGDYGDMHVPGAANFPGARAFGSGWTDTDGNLWLFGGEGYDKFGNYGLLNDMWMYDIASNQWTWRQGPHTTPALGMYNTRGAPSIFNQPGSRKFATAITDAAGDFWLFGGEGSDAFTHQTSGERYLNDLWKYDRVFDTWTWISGEMSAMSPGSYGTKGVTVATNMPGSRGTAVGFGDGTNHLYIMGGVGPMGVTNDLWKYNIATDLWTWISGSNVSSPPGSYGTKGIAAPSNEPPFRFFHSGWTDASGNFWIMGGIGYNYYNDLWKYDPLSNQWTWMHGDATSSQNGIYGTKGVAAAVNKPGARYLPQTWRDAAGNLWLYGSEGNDGYSNVGSLKDVWMYSPGSNEWTWQAGPDLIALPTIYGSRGTGTDHTGPSRRRLAAHTTDASGHLWLFGGSGQDATGINGLMGDLWKYNTVTRQWVWTGGSSSANNAGVYGTLGAADPSFQPGARENASIWTDASGNLWLFGGSGYDAAGNRGILNDLWKFDVVSNQWSWINGNNTRNQPTVSGAKGVAAITNQPGSRMAAASWRDASGNLWLYGGKNFSFGDMNDVWQYEITSGQWLWVGGDNMANQAGNYGMINITAASSKPGGRNGMVVSGVAGNKILLFGGSGYGATGYGQLNDLWEYNLATNEWTWKSGDQTPNQAGLYGSIGVAASGNKPGGRFYTTSWTDANSNFWIYGGSGRNAAGIQTNLSDLWKYDRATGNWTWITGNPAGTQTPNYGTLRAPAATNSPGSRNGMASWTQAGRLWMFGGSNNSGDLWSFADFGTLPLVWKNFTARKNGTAALLEWQTASEQEVKYFVMERSENGQRFDSIGKVAARNQLSTMFYTFNDRNPLNGNNFYRIREIDKDGSTTYSPVAMVAFAQEQRLTWTQSGNQVRVHLSGGSSERYVLFDGRGRMVYQGRFQQGVVSFRALTPGIYLLDAKRGNENLSLKMLVR